MRIIHLSDLHLGKRVNGFSMISDQRYILEQILGIIKNEQADAVFIAGDIYDKAVPSLEAVQLFDDFLVKLSKLGLKVFIVSGNHDSPERIAFASRIISESGIYLSPVYDGHIEKITVNDEFGPLNVYLLPFIKPVHVRAHYSEENIDTYTDAVRTALMHTDIDENERNVIIAHQFVTGASRSDSEEQSVGGLDNVDACVFDAFDYVALGHIHGPQNIGSVTVRYSGTPLKYSFSEEKHEKSVTVVHMYEKGCVSVHTVPLIPFRDMKTIKGSYMDIMSKQFYEDIKTDDYMRVILTDEEDIPDVAARIRIVYKNLMLMEYDNTRTKNNKHITGNDAGKKASPMELFSDLYKRQNNKEMTDTQKDYLGSLIKKVWEDEI